MSSLSSPPRARWYPIVVAMLVLAIVILCTAALLGLADDIPLGNGLLGFFTGLFTVLTLGLVAVTEIGRRNDAASRDAAALDELEPLRAATAGETSDDQPASGLGARQS